MRGRLFSKAFAKIAAAAPTIQRADLTSRLRSAFNIKGKSVTPTLGDICHPVAIVEDMSRKDSIFDSGIDRSGGWYMNVSAGGAGQTGYGILWNPAGSGILVAPTRVQITNPTTTGYWSIGLVYVLPGAAALNSPAFLLDTRLSDPVLLTPPSCSCAQYTGTLNAVVGSPIWYGRSLASSPISVDTSGIVLAENVGMVVQCQTANQDIIASMFWRERTRLG